MKKKKKYSITVGRKPNLDKKLASQNSQESVDEGENTANVEDSVTEKECSKDYGLFIFLFKNLVINYSL